MILSFRRERVAIQGDVKGMYHQERIPDANRNFLRFLWRKDGRKTNELQTYRMCSYLFGTVSSPACANYVPVFQQTSEDHESEFYETTIDTVNNCFYVDDCVVSAPTAEEAKRLLAKLCLLLNPG